MSYNAVNKKKFVVTDKTPIGFGKFKGKPHSVLLEKKNLKYSMWVLAQVDFKYYATWKWLKNKLEVEFGDEKEDFDLLEINDGKRSKSDSEAEEEVEEVKEDAEEAD